MPEHADTTIDPVTAKVRAAADGLLPMLAQAQAVWDERAGNGTDHGVRPGWRAFEDAFPTFYQFTNRPR